jgi:hypothetical protein
MQVTVGIPDQVARQWGETPDAVGRQVLEDAVVETILTSGGGWPAGNKQCQSKHRNAKQNGSDYQPK